MMRLPVAVEPVNMILSIPGRARRRAPTSPAAGHGGQHLRRQDPVHAPRPGRAPISGVYSEGLTTTVLPMRRAGAICQIAIIIGQFHGAITPTTPTGR